jgi:type IV fimbrial biogenesis protein FimT
MRNGGGGRRTRGFLMIEWWVVLALAVVAAAFAVPSLVAWRMRDRVDAQARLMLASLAYARGEAIRLGARVVMCRGATDAGCEAGGRCVAGETDWSCGWTVAAPGAGGQPGVLRRVAGDARVAVNGAARVLAFTPPAGQLIGDFRRFEFAPREASRGDGDPGARRCVRIAAGGRARLAQGACE